MTDEQRAAAERIAAPILTEAQARIELARFELAAATTARDAVIAQLDAEGVKATAQARLLTAGREQAIADARGTYPRTGLDPSADELIERLGAGGRLGPINRVTVQKIVDAAAAARRTAQRT